MMSLWDQYVRPLGAKYGDLFAAAEVACSIKFHEVVIKPSLFRGDTYRALALDPRVPGRNHVIAESLASGEFGPEGWRACCLFTDPLLVVEPEDPRFHHPSQRACLTGHCVFSYEHDVNDINFLKEQLDWLIPTEPSSGNARITDLFNACSEFTDFVGITVAFSGNKSLHIHIVFENTDFKKLFSAEDDVNIGLSRHWERLRATVSDILKPSDQVGSDGTKRPTLPDSMIKSPAAYRRLPWGERVLEKTNLLGMPPRTVVPQITLWEKFRRRTAKGTTLMFLTPSLFTPDAPRPRVGPSKTFSGIGSRLSTEQVAFCERKLREFYDEPDGVRLAGIGWDHGRNIWVARFFNYDADSNPSSVMLETHQTILFAGAGAEGREQRSLPYPLGTMMHLWCRAHGEEVSLASLSVDNVDRTDGDPDEQQHHFIEPYFKRVGPALITDFAYRVVDGASARTVMEEWLPKLIASEPITILRGPEGATKTSSILRMHHTIMQERRGDGDGGKAVYAFGDYDTAVQKAADFDLLHSDGGRYKAVVWRGFTAAYAIACERLKLSPITEEDRKAAGYPSLWSLVKSRQPDVMKEFRRLHAEIWAMVGDREHVIFTVHAVADRWGESTRSRTMWARSFWIDGDQNVGSDRVRSETSLALLVHDEAKWSTFADAVSEPTYEWLNSLVRHDSETWGSERVNQKQRALDEYVVRFGWPHSVKEISYDDVERYVGIGENWDEVVTADTGEYLSRACDELDKDIYARTHGSRWYLTSRRWWQLGDGQVASRIIILTTEAVPMFVGQKAHPGLYVVDCRAEKLQRDMVETRPARFVTSEKLATLVESVRNDLQADTGEEWYVISNKVSSLPSTITHARARGSNELRGLNILQTCTFMAPGEYEQQQALNAWTGRSDLVHLRHVDEINQSAGRNRGFRRIGKERHVLLINRRLWTLLNHSLVRSYFRYDLVVSQDNQARKDARRPRSLP